MQPADLEVQAPIKNIASIDSATLLNLYVVQCCSLLPNPKPLANTKACNLWVYHICIIDNKGGS